MQTGDPKLKAIASPQNFSSAKQLTLVQKMSGNNIWDGKRPRKVLVNGFTISLLPYGLEDNAGIERINYIVILEWFWEVLFLGVAVIVL